MKIPPEPRFLTRRELFGVIGVTAAAPLVVSLGSSASPGKTGTALQAPSCVVRPEQTEGPYFVDRTMNRSDIRSDPSDGTVQQGTPLHLVLRASRVTDGSCTPLGGAIVDVWQCDASGVYSDFRDFNGLFDSRGKRFLRGIR
jgi:protocatechuate 3,4-dioxygenase beta subunit